MKKSMGWDKKCDYCKKKQAILRVLNKKGYVVYTCIDCEINIFEDIINRHEGEETQ